MKYIVLVVTLTLSLLSVRADSFVGMENYPQAVSAVPDYLKFQQGKQIEGALIQDVLYPTLGFPALIESDDHTLSALFHCSTKPLGATLILSKKINGSDVPFLSVEADSFEKLKNQNICKVTATIPPVLPATVFDLTIRLIGGAHFFSPHAVGFVKDGPIRFIVFADPQIEDLQAKSATKMNYNDHMYPGYSDSLLDYSIQEGIIGISISQYNISQTDFVTTLGDIVFSIDYNKEYIQIADFLLHSEIPMFAVPGNHDGYAQFNDQNDFNSGLLFDGLNYWRAFVGPVSSAFKVKGKTLLMLNTYGGTAARRASGPPLGIGDNAVTPVSNFGGFLEDTMLTWIGNILLQQDVVGIFSHQLPLGLPQEERYHAMQKFPKNSALGAALNFQEWNYETAAFDSNPADTIADETPDNNTGTTLAREISLYDKPIAYFSGHAHIDRNNCFKKGENLIPDTDITASKDVCFYQTTTAASSGSHYWGIRPVSFENGVFHANYLCDGDEPCYPDSSEHPGFQSIPTGNLWVEYHWKDQSSLYLGGDGTSEVVRATVTNYLPTNVPVTLRFILPSHDGGYSINNTDFSIDGIAQSENGALTYLTVSGTIAAGTTEEQFLKKDFHATKLDISVKVEKGSSDGIHPVIVCPETVQAEETVQCEIDDNKKLISYAWTVNGVLLSARPTISFPAEQCDGQCTVSVKVFDTYGRNGTAETTVAVTEPTNEDSDIDTDSVLETEQTDADTECDNEYDDEDEAVPHKTSNGCSALLLPF